MMAGIAHHMGDYMTTHCALCNGEYVELMITRHRPFEGGSLTVHDIPARKCDCDVLTSLPDGVIVDGYKWLLEKNGIIGDVTVSLSKLKERFEPMDFIRPHLNIDAGA
ncbi:hypothetical protein Theco_3997 (plasmid) [Thermobacillus composti KWC4]|jgi:hypothetical protein|uniref:YgiT-type zinc finger domain protein n=1 Tax=Thermobacillus composti (strain DSM 18247 / JCM 13945 / KWC4) TaxID=717605 RepID=L0EJP2_THECK|nr:hypothetical protein Theco_3997 [Thermobacillus composti KWC4]